MTRKEVEQSIELLRERIQETVLSHLDSLAESVPQDVVTAIAVVALKMNVKAILDAYEVASK